MYDLILDFTDNNKVRIRKTYQLITDFCDHDAEIKYAKGHSKGTINAIFLKKSGVKKNSRSLTNY